MPKQTYQPKTRRRLRVHGFRERMSTQDGQNVIKRRRQHGPLEVGDDVDLPEADLVIFEPGIPAPRARALRAGAPQGILLD